MFLDAQISLVTLDHLFLVSNISPQGSYKAYVTKPLLA